MSEPPDPYGLSEYEPLANHSDQQQLLKQQIKQQRREARRLEKKKRAMELRHLREQMGRRYAEAAVVDEYRNAKMALAARRSRRHELEEVVHHELAARGGRHDRDERRNG